MLAVVPRQMSPPPTGSEEARRIQTARIDPGRLSCQPGGTALTSPTHGTHTHTHIHIRFIFMTTRSTHIAIALIMTVPATVSKGREMS